MSSRVVVTGENLVEFVKTGVAPAFVPPEGAKKPDVEVKPEAATNGSDGTTVQPRGTDGKFESPSGEKSPPEKGKAAPQPAADDDPDGKNLTDHARRVIGKKHRQMKEAEEFARERDADAAAERARADALQRELDSLKGAKSGQGPATAEGSDLEEPKQEDFKTVGEYARALTKYEVAKARRDGQAALDAERQKTQQERAKTQAQDTINAFVERREAYIEAHPEFEETLSKSDVEIPDAGMQYIVESEKGMELTAHLMQNPEIVERLSKLSPARVIAELGKLEARLEAPAATTLPNVTDKGQPPKQQARQVSRAPAPVQPLNTDAATAVQKDPSQMTFPELRAFREQQRKQGQYR